MLNHSRLAALFLTVSLAFLALIPCAQLPAAETDPPTADVKGNVPEDIQRLVAQLDGAEFAERQRASDQLSQAGAAAFPALEKVAGTGSREVAGRAISILQSHLQGGDDDAQKAARASLERLAKSNISMVASKAAEALNPPKPQPVFANRLGVAPVRIANIQIAARAPVRNGRRTTVRTVNGERQITVEENGRKIHIQASPGKPIQVEVTETKNGKETTEKIEAKDAAELKTKHAEAHKYYESYAARAPIAVNGAAADPRAQMIQSLQTHIDRLKAQPAGPTTQRQIDSLEQAKQRLAQTILPGFRVAPAAPEPKPNAPAPMPMAPAPALP